MSTKKISNICYHICSHNCTFRLSGILMAHGESYDTFFEHSYHSMAADPWASIAQEDEEVEEDGEGVNTVEIR